MDAGRQMLAPNPYHLTPDPRSPPRWHYGAPGQVVIPHTAVTAAVVRLLPFVTWVAADATATTYQVTPTRLRQAIGQGWSPEQLWALLAPYAGPVPPTWQAGLAPPTATIRIAPEVLVTTDVPAVLHRAARARSVRRHLGPRLAPGIATLAPEAVGPFARALARQGVRTTITPPHPAPAPTDLSPGACAALLVACAFYRACAPPTAPLLPDAGLEHRLRTALSPHLRQATEAALADLHVSLPTLPAPIPWQPTPPPLPVARLVTVTPAEPAAAPPDHGPPPAAAQREPPPGRRPRDAVTLRATLRRHIAQQQVVTITYTNAQGTISTRLIRPLELTQHGDSWYLRAFCQTRGTERTFRLDRIAALTTAGPDALPVPPAPAQGGSPILRHPSSPPARPRPAQPQRRDPADFWQLDRDLPAADPAPPTRSSTPVPADAALGFFALPAAHARDPAAPRVWLEEEDV